MRISARLVFVLSLVAVISMMGITRPAVAGETLLCASTTSTQNSGLFDHILPIYEKLTGVRVHVVAQGTGAALQSGKRGDVDVVLVHAKDDELRLVEEGYFVDRRDVMYNDFIVLGPAEDPAGIGAASSAPDAFTRISRVQAPFVSRGDNSGTHKKELKLWAASGLRPEGRWYMEVGQGQAKTMRVANEKRAYVLTDRGTWLSIKAELQMEVLYQGDPALFNQYGVMAVNPQRHPHVKYQRAKEFIEWLVSEDGQRAIASFRVGGKQLFIPNAKP